MMQCALVISGRDRGTFTPYTVNDIAVVGCNGLDIQASGDGLDVMLDLADTLRAAVDLVRQKAAAEVTA